MKTPQAEIVIYQSSKKTFEVKLNAQKLWLNLQQIADLFDHDKSVISRHFTNIFKEKELERNSVVAKNAITAANLVMTILALEA